MLNLVRRIPLYHNYTFATSKHTVNYYNVLEVESGATEKAIRQAYADLTQHLRPQFDLQRLKALNEAFVILTDNKTRDAYDSLLAVKKSFYLSPEPPKVLATRSYLSARKKSKEQELKKKINIDEFGRYKGGLPQPKGHIRGQSLNQTGTMYRQDQVENAIDRNPEFNTITAEKAESFKNFHQDQRKARTMKWPWFTFQVDYDYFTFRTFRLRYWPRIQLFILFFYILPTLYYTVQKFEKRAATTELKEKAAEKARKQQEAVESKEQA